MPDAATPSQREYVTDSYARMVARTGAEIPVVLILGER
jgi:hypothetical protein